MEDGLPPPRRYRAIAVILMTATLVAMDNAIVNVALPTIVAKLRLTASAGLWALTAFQIGMIIALFPSAALGEVKGYRRVFLYGLALFTLFAALSTMSGSITLLAVARFVQGLGGGAIMSVFPALVRFTYPHRQLGRAVGLNGLSVALASAAGPMIGGLITTYLQWRWAFAITIPFCLVALTIGKSLPDNSPSQRRLDNWSVLLNCVALSALVVGVQQLPHSRELAIALLLVFVVAGAALIRRERNVRHPLVPLDLFSDRIFASAAGTSLCVFAAQMIAFVTMPFVLLYAGHNHLTTAFLLACWPSSLALTSPLAGSLADRYGSAALCCMGATLMAIALMGMALIAPSETVGFALCSLVGGVGVGLFVPPNNRTLLTRVAPHRSGSAGSLQAAARIGGQTVGAVIVSVLFAMGANHRLPSALAFMTGGAIALFAVMACLFRQRADRLRAGPPLESVMLPQSATDFEI